MITGCDHGSAAGQGEPAAGAAAVHGPAGRLRACLPWAALALVILAVLAAATREARHSALQSDGAAIALQAWQMLHGNPLLRGWRTSDVSFYTTELPLYMAVEALRGPRADVAAISEAFNYTLLVALAAVVARGRVRGREGMVRALLTAGIMTAPSLATAGWLLNDADHAATAIWVLLALLAFDRFPARWPGPVLAGLILAWAAVGDPLVEVIGAAPLILVGLARACPDLLTGRAPLRARWYEVSLLAAGAGSVAVAAVATRLIADAGGWSMTTKGYHFVTEEYLPSNLAVEFRDCLAVFSADFFGMRAGAGLLPVLVHLAGVAAVTAAIAVAVRGFAPFRGKRADGDLVADVLVTGVACNLVAYLLLYAALPGQIREVSPVFALGAALAGRVLGRPLTRTRLEGTLVAGAACYLLTMGPALTAAPRPPANEALTRWLGEHHLASGIAGYWQADSVTFDSIAAGGPAITIRPVRGDAKGRPVPYPWEADLNQLNPAAYRANFLVLAPGAAAPRPPVTVRGAVRAFGRPARAYRFQGYTILVWNENILFRLPRGRPADDSL
jgi:hypothetical protein